MSLLYFICFPLLLIREESSSTGHARFYATLFHVPHRSGGGLRKKDTVILMCILLS
jgi:hypothetical protein